MRYTQDLANVRIVPAAEMATLAQATPVHPEHADFQFPRWIWAVMLGGYGLLLAGLLGATADSGRAVFAVVISAAYVAMFFGTANVLANVDGRRVGAFNRRGGDLQTWTGPMDMRSVAGQVLVLPAVLGFFGIWIAIVSAVLT